jgi:SAM-dependent methyltransferase
LTAKCPNCGRAEGRFAFKAKDYEHGVPGEWQIVECPGCGLFYQDPLPRPEEIPGFYPPTYSAYNSAGMMRWLFDFAYWLDARRVRGLIGSRGRILDIGCGDGSALMKMRSHGDWELYGVEFDAAAAAKARARGIDARAGDVGGAGFEDESFDLIRMGHVIEHVLDPAQTVAHVSRLLKPGGYFVGETPNADCVDFRLFGKYWGSLHVPRHLTFFNPENLARLLTRLGFRDVKVEPRLRTVGWSCSIQNFLVDHAGLRVPVSGRVSWYPLLIVPFLPFTAMQALIGGRTGNIGFTGRKP